MIDALQRRHPWLPPALARRLARSYGSRAMQLIGQAHSLEQLGTHFGADLYAAEVDYLRHHEWARSAEDILWRRSKLGLRVSPGDRQRLQQYLDGVAAVSTSVDANL